MFSNVKTHTEEVKTQDTATRVQLDNDNLFAFKR